MIEFFSQVLFEFFLGAPGAFVLWTLKGFKGSYSDILTKRYGLSILTGLAFWVLIAGTFGLLARGA